ncbi:hypothetical protein SSP531S_13480 [Streptomyces spongiicola]|uniref:Uncharacterized protein n=2 Tax=Streptomyces TaxID=1883 RepID=A0A6A0B540_9ACTN|nr:DUF5372 family protein [Streptomyces spongiicola]GBP99944.1 hypothetical protein SSP531S_13480 [Streptomyces spongiicola]GFH39598.1 hypothetical protein SCWH03_58670 [Streptomyces pacificus]
MRVTHPFHPLFGRELEFIERRQCWRGDRVYYFDEVGGRSRIPTEWTSEAPVDAFVVAAEGSCPFRTQDLVELAALVDRLRGSNRGTVGEIAP